MEVDLTRLHGLSKLIAKAVRGFERKFVILITNSH
jgi:hypothetical protein